MKTSERMLALVVLTTVMLSAAGCTKLQARDQLNKGVGAYKNAKYEEAIGHFQKATELDPGLLNAKLYLATAYAQQYVPGIDSPENMRFGQQAIDEYKAVLDKDPKNVNSVKGIAYIYLNMKRFDDAKAYYRQASGIDPNDPEPYYSVAVIDWTQSFQPRMEARAKISLKPDQPLNDKKVCAMLKEKNMGVVQDGIDNLSKAIELRPDYDDAMAYLNLLYRERADVECTEPDARVADLKKADEWVDKTLAVKKAKAEKKPDAQGIVLDQPK